MEYEIISKTITPGYTNDQGNFIQTGEPTLKYYIKYYGGLMDGQTEFYGLDLNNPSIEIRENYIKKLDKTNLEEYKKHIIDKIDENAKNKIYEGFYFDGKIFSLSQNAQMNWLGIRSIPEQMFPYKLSTKDDDLYYLEYNRLNDFYFSALNGKAKPLDDANILKQQLKSLTTVEEIDQFVINNNL